MTTATASFAVATSRPATPERIDSRLGNPQDGGRRSFAARRIQVCDEITNSSADIAVRVGPREDGAALKKVSVHLGVVDHQCSRCEVTVAMSPADARQIGLALTDAAETTDLPDLAGRTADLLVALVAQRWPDHRVDARSHEWAVRLIQRIVNGLPG
jgi:hypothetical protein